MTEYVDSAGIWTPTPRFYNLVPSFIEQPGLQPQRTLDVHTDIAKRSWTQGGYPTPILNSTPCSFSRFGAVLDLQRLQSDAKLGWLYPSSSVQGTLRYDPAQP